MSLKTVPRILLAILLLEIPLQIDTYLFYHETDGEVGAVAGLIVSLGTFCLLVLYALWLIDASSPGSPGLRIRVLGIPLLVYLAAVVFSLAAAENVQLTLFEIALLTQSFLLFFFLANHLRTKPDVRFVAGLLTVSLLMQSAIIIGVRLVGHSLHLPLISAEIGLDHRVSGTIGSATSAGSFLALLLVPACSLLVCQAPRPLKVLALAAFILGLVAIFLTQSRGAILAVALSCFIFGALALWRGWLPNWVPWLAPFLVLVTILPLYEFYQTRIAKGDEGSAESRIHLAQIAMRSIEKHPVLGVGAGNSHLAARQIADSGPFRSEWFFTVHCKYLLVWVETGIVGLVAFLWFLLVALGQGWKTWQRGDRELAPLALGLALAIGAQMVHMTVDIFNARPQVQTLWVCAGLLAAMALLRPDEAPQDDFNRGATADV